MKKMKKLLSVVLAVIMALSCMSVLASAQIVSYKTTDNLTSLGAYSPYGAVTRMKTTDRMAMVLDWLDKILGQANITLNGGGYELKVLGATILSITLDFRSVDLICDSLDSIASKDSFLGILGGDIKNLELKGWKSGMSRKDTDALAFVSELTELLNANAATIGAIIGKGNINLGSILSGFVDVSVVNNLLGNLPGTLAGLFTGLLERKDDTVAYAKSLAGFKAGDNLEAMVSDFIGSLFTKPMSSTTIKFEADGKTLKSDHTEWYNRFIGTDANPDNWRYKYTHSKDDKGQYVTSYVYDGKKGTYVEDIKFTLTEEYIGGEPTGDWVYSGKDDAGNDVNLKYYEDKSYLLPSYAAAVKNDASLNIDLDSKSLADNLYDIVPYVFQEMAPVVLNGSMKKILAQFFGTKFTLVGNVKDNAFVPDDKIEATEIISKFGLTFTDKFFTEPQREYIWEWSNYKVIDGKHFYRFEDQVFFGDTTSANGYLGIIDWTYTIPDNLIANYVPSSADGATKSAKNYTTILQGTNDFLVELAGIVLDEAYINGKTETVDIAYKTGNNTNLVANLKNVAQAIIQVEPKSIFGSKYETDSYYNALIVTDNDQTVLAGIAATVVDLLMPQMILPTGQQIIDQKITVGAILAATVRELATQLLPSVDYDALIYKNYNTKTFVEGKDNEYWLDVLLTMGVDIGFKYLHNLADMNEDKAAWTALGWTDSKVYAATDLNEVNGVKPWEAKVDYIIDWALTKSGEKGDMCTWNMANLVSTNDRNGTAYKIDMATVQDPWVKLDGIFASLLPEGLILNVTNASGMTRYETILRENLIMAIADLEWNKILDMLIIPTSSANIRTTNTIDAVFNVVVNILNNLLKKVGGGNLIDTSYYTGINDLFAIDTSNQNYSKLYKVVESLLTKLHTARANGLLETALPILNFFLGWTTDAQKYGDASLVLADFIQVAADATSASTTLKVYNNAQGMLLKHRNSSVVDTQYTLVVDNITGDMTAKTTTARIDPYGFAEFTLDTSYSADKVCRVVVEYHIEKDGKQLGESSKAVKYVLVSNIVQDIVTDWEDGYEAKKSTYVVASVQGKAKKGAVVLDRDSLASTIEALSWTIASRRDTDTTITACTFTPGNTTYIADSGASAALVNTTLEAVPDGSKTGDPITINVAKWAYTGDVDNISYPGTIALGKASVSVYGEHKGIFKTYKGTAELSCDFGTLYYTDMGELVSLVSSERNSGRLEEDYTSDSWNTYIAALKDAIMFVDVPKTQATFLTTYIEANITAKQEALKAAVKGLEQVTASATTGEKAKLEAALKTAEPGGNVPEINFQDYDLYEYFEYQDFRTEVRNRINAYTAPKAPAEQKLYTIGGYAITDDAYNEDGTPCKELTDVLLASASGNMLTGLQNAIVGVTEEETEAYNAAVEAYGNGPVYTAISNADLANKIVYYKQFIIPVASDDLFIDKEIAYAQANFPINDDTTKALYTEASWNNYVEKYNNAVGMTDSDIPSVVFDAKYNLMKAMNELMLKSDSVLEYNGSDETILNTVANLKAAIEKAEAIFANEENTLTDEAIADGWTLEKAYAYLIEELGYKYVNQYGDDVYLFSDSALEFASFDRPNNTNNLKRVNASTEALNTAIELFVVETAAPELGVVEGSTGVIGETTTDEETGLVTGYIYGVTAGTSAEEYFTLVDDTAGTVEWTASTLSATGTVDGTGATATVKNTDGKVTAVYTLVVFGDVNGDGEIKAADKASINLCIVNGSSASLSEIQAFAGDVNGDGEIKAADKATVNLCVTSGSYDSITVNPYLVG